MWTSSQNMSVVYQRTSSTKNRILLFLSADVKWNINIYYLGCLLFKMTHHSRDHSTDSISHNSSNYRKSPLMAILFSWNIILSYFPFNALWKFAHTAEEEHSFRKYWAHLSQVSLCVGLKSLPSVSSTVLNHDEKWLFPSPNALPPHPWSAESRLFSCLCPDRRWGAQRSGCDEAA